MYHLILKGMIGITKMRQQKIILYAFSMTALTIFF